MSSLCLQHGVMLGETLFTTSNNVLHHCITTLSHQWAIVMYNVEPTLDQRKNDIWDRATYLELCLGWVE